jgi:uncharacterized membrane protein YciS (DUF1049 family)
MSDTTKTGTSFVISPRVWLGLAIAAIALAFILQNRQPVAINLLLLSLTAPLWTALTGIFAAGLATGWLLSRRRK